MYLRAVDSETVKRIFWLPRWPSGPRALLIDSIENAPTASSEEPLSQSAPPLPSPSCGRVARMMSPRAPGMHMTVVGTSMAGLVGSSGYHRGGPTAVGSNPGSPLRSVACLKGQEPSSWTLPPRDVTAPGPWQSWPLLSATIVSATNVWLPAAR